MGCLSGGHALFTRRCSPSGGLYVGREETKARALAPFKQTRDAVSLSRCLQSLSRSLRPLRPANMPVPHQIPPGPIPDMAPTQSTPLPTPHLSPIPVAQKARKYACTF